MRKGRLGNMIRLPILIAPRQRPFVKKMTPEPSIVAKSPRAKNRRGATVLEYAVVGVVVLILLAIISMGVLRTRETARDHLCRRRLVLLSRAVNGYVDIQGEYPGFVNPVNGAQVQSLSWVAETLPYLEDRLPMLVSTREGWEIREEQHPEQFSPASRPSSDWERALKSTVPFLICPSENSERIKPGVSSFVASCGYADAKGDSNPADYLANGIFLDRRRLPGLSERTLQTLDGTEFTILLGENVQSGNWDSGRESDVGFVWSEGLAQVRARAAGEPEVLSLNRGLREAADGYKTARPSSHHASGVHLAFANTRITKFSSNIDSIVYIRLCTVDDMNLKNPWSKKSIGPPIGRERIEQTPGAPEAENAK
jgi:hypothetical protein